MEIHEISFFEEFECIGGKCPQTCCKGWQIPLSDDDLERFMDTKGLLKLKIMAAISEGEPKVFNSDCYRCPFHNRQGLCDMQRKRGHDFIPEVCRSYPRFVRNYGEFAERYIDLSCIAGARLFMKHAHDLHCVIRDGASDCALSVTNDDTDFLRALIKDRTDMTAALLSAASYEDLIYTLNTIDSYAIHIQNAYLKGDPDHIHSLSFASFKAASLSDIFPLSAAETDRLMHSALFHIRLKRTNTELYDLIKNYYHMRKRLTSTQAKWQNACASFMSAHPQSVRYYGAYFAYYLYQFYLKNYEDYSFVRNIRTGVIHLTCLILLDIIYEYKHSSLTGDEFARIIAVYNRRAFFSDTILDDMYRTLDQRNIVRQDFP